jgi:hypothetical protein
MWVQCLQHVLAFILVLVTAPRCQQVHLLNAAKDYCNFGVSDGHGQNHLLALPRVLDADLH